ncbi:asparagine synthase (glutamine-hydrolyzing) [Clostridium sp. D2Q-11]|uniref:asparagine synthase (glutamine-hydrolyzing) n=1 Tax=Anaeromonas frigoriresistens TaxID=2683708 RepID=A0A942UW76_9FIRM|nr:asparagine synthase (glutamine-hydrolyzing) [Anaeromonas frigoriresistens]MBS4538031.1 asparagine synthase (glutamine-hydrolyzing) [Anaeromonas frigoriresistens]
MCGIAGWIDNNIDLTEKTQIIQEMIHTLENRGPDNGGIYISKDVLLGHRRLSIIDPKGGYQPMIKNIEEREFTIVYNGELYNTEEVREKLKDKGYKFTSYSDTEVLLTSYIEWGVDCLKHINGIFSFGIWNKKYKRLFLSRDHLGVKPLFYSCINGSLIFASEIKALLKHPYIEPTVDKIGLMEVFGLGPARSLGSGVFRDIKEVPPAHYLIYDENGLKVNQYWELEAKPHTEGLDETSDHVRSLFIDAVERQLVSDVPLCTFLSGGLDSSAISAIASEAFKRDGRGRLDTFSIDYKDNDKYFKSSEFQPDPDSQWIGVMEEYINSNHTNVELTSKELIDSLRGAVLARDLPGMADIDSSLLLFCKEVRNTHTVALSGECADEIFGGYPWFRNKEDIKTDTFPWSKNVGNRRRILSKDLKDLPIEEYVREKYNDTLNHVPKLYGESSTDGRMRELFYLNIKWFMITLLNRKDRMSMANSLEVRVPFADYRLVEYAYNIPKEFKFYLGREKGILRKALRGILPDEIIDRKKSPYPKTHHPVYTELVQKEMKNILSDKSSPVLELIDYTKVKEIVDSKGKSYTKPWFGQLMTGPQLMAYLIQLNIWLKEYKVRLV